MKSKLYTQVYYNEDALNKHKFNIIKRGGKVTVRKLYDEAIEKYYWELSYYFNS